MGGFLVRIMCSTCGNTPIDLLEKHFVLPESQLQEAQTESDARVLERIVAAFTVEGPRPNLHRKAQAKLRREWPTLYNALVAAAATAPPR